MSTDQGHGSSGVLSFDVDGMLGRLAKWLRILGFDAEYPVKGPRTGRVFVTTKSISATGNVVRVASNDPMEQVGQVLEETGVRPDPDLFLSRCLVCNVPVEEGHVETVAQRVPAAVLDLKEIFHECPRCGRVYWEGTHAARIKRRLNAGGIPLG